MTIVSSMLLVSYCENVSKQTAVEVAQDAISSCTGNGDGCAILESSDRLRQFTVKVPTAAANEVQDSLIQHPAIARVVVLGPN